MKYYPACGLIPQAPGIVCAVGGGIEGGPAVESYLISTLACVCFYIW
jgi:hypothetical protein